MSDDSGVGSCSCCVMLWPEMPTFGDVVLQISPVAFSVVYKNRHNVSNRYTCTIFERIRRADFSENTLEVRHVGRLRSGYEVPLIGALRSDAKDLDRRFRNLSDRIFYCAHKSCIVTCSVHWTRVEWFSSVDFSKTSLEIRHVGRLRCRFELSLCGTLTWDANFWRCRSPDFSFGFSCGAQKSSQRIQ